MAGNNKAAKAAKEASKAYAEMTQEELLLAIQKKDEEIAEKDEVIVELNKELKDAKSGKASAQKFAIVTDSKKNKYELRIPKFKFKGQDCDEKVLSSDAELVDKLVEIGSGALHKIEK